MKKLFFTLFMTIGFGVLSKAQLTAHSAIYTGYSYQNQSFADLGMRFFFLKNDDAVYRLSGGAMLGSVHKEFAIMPKIEADVLARKNSLDDLSHGLYYLAGIESTTKYVAPKVGFSILGIMDFTVGYAFSYKYKTLNNNELNGLNFNFTINAPLIMLRK